MVSGKEVSGFYKCSADSHFAEMEVTRRVRNFGVSFEESEMFADDVKQNCRPEAMRVMEISERMSCGYELLFPGCSVARIVEEELIAVGIIDDQEPVAPGAVLDGNALGLEFRAEGV